MESFLDDKSSDGVWNRFHFATRKGITRDEVVKVYDKWAEIFDEDFERVGAIADCVRSERAKILTRLSPQKEGAKILDLCAGTGLLGLELKDIGFTDLDALDGSKNMLAAAEKKGVYHKLILHSIDEDRIPIDDNTYDGILGGYCLFPGHIEDGKCFPELARIVRSGGKIIFIAYINELLCYEATLKQMVQAGIWKYEVYRTAFSVSGVDERDGKADIIEISVN